jgi:hypothetical protein
MKIGRCTAQALVAACAILLLGTAVRADPWDLRMLDGGTPVTGTLTYDLGTWTEGALPGPGSLNLNFNALLRNLSGQQDLWVGGYYDGFSGAAPALDGRTWWTSQGENHVGDMVGPGLNLTAWLGTFNGSAFVSALPANGTQYSALIDFTYVAVNDQGEAFDPVYLPNGITPGPPSLRIYGRVNPRGGGNVIPEASTLTLLGTMGLWAAPLGLWRYRKARAQNTA